ncbi:hypothetical protein IWX46DRAFT_591920, partial [Phyllosticta citricarpa]
MKKRLCSEQTRCDRRRYIDQKRNSSSASCPPQKGTETGGKLNSLPMHSCISGRVISPNPKLQTRLTGTVVAVPLLNEGKKMVMVWRWCRSKQAPVSCEVVASIIVAGVYQHRHLLWSFRLPLLWLHGMITAPDVIIEHGHDKDDRDVGENCISGPTTRQLLMPPTTNSSLSLPPPSSYRHLYRPDTRQEGNVRTHARPRQPPNQQQGQAGQARRLHRPNRKGRGSGSTDMRVHLGTRMTVTVREGFRPV